MEFSAQDILRFLLPSGGGNTLFEFLLYIVFVLGLITMFLIPDKNLLPTLLIATVLLMALVSKVSLVQPIGGFGKRDFGSLIMNVSMFALPFIVAGMIRSRRKKSAIFPAILTGLFGGIYFFLFWVFFQRG